MELTQLAEAIKSAVEKSAEGEGKKAVAFSGGLDSSLIAWILRERHDVEMFSVGTRGSRDLEWVDAHAYEFGLTLHVCALSDSDIAEIFQQLQGKYGFDFLSCDILIAFYKACEIAEKSGCARIIAGAGAEEVFIGYRKYLDEANKGKEVSQIRKDAIAYWHSGKGDGAKLGRVAAQFGLGLEVPFLDNAVVEEAGKIGDAMHLPQSPDLSKPVLRQVAKEFGLPGGLCNRKKMAMQYGSGVHKKLVELKKLKIIK
jgi:asparagine synthase (glutamine-hydrolysing)